MSVSVVFNWRKIDIYVNLLITYKLIHASKWLDDLHLEPVRAYSVQSCVRRAYTPRQTDLPFRVLQLKLRHVCPEMIEAPFCLSFDTNEWAGFPGPHTSSGSPPYPITQLYTHIPKMPKYCT